MEPPRSACVCPQVTIIKLNSIRGGDDLYVRSEVRKGRTQQTRTIDNCRDPVFNEEFNLIVDSFKDDVLKLQVGRGGAGVWGFLGGMFPQAHEKAETQERGVHGMQVQRARKRGGRHGDMYPSPMGKSHHGQKAHPTATTTRGKHAGNDHQARACCGRGRR